jgi:hypothetical protein
MALETLSSQFGSGGTKLTDQGAGGLKRILTELRGLTVTGAAGVGAGSDITVTGMTAEDTVIAVINITTPAAPTTLVPSNFVPKAGGLLTSTLATTSQGLLIVWMNKR